MIIFYEIKGVPWLACTHFWAPSVFFLKNTTYSLYLNININDFNWFLSQNINNFDWIKHILILLIFLSYL